MQKDSAAEDSATAPVKQVEATPVAFLFPGQGSQAVGMLQVTARAHAMSVFKGPESSLSAFDSCKIGSVRAIEK